MLKNDHHGCRAERVNFCDVLCSSWEFWDEVPVCNEWRYHVDEYQLYIDDTRPPFSSCGFYWSAAYVQLEFGESAASIRVRLLIKCGFYTRLYGKCCFSVIWQHLLIDWDWCVLWWHPMQKIKNLPHTTQIGTYYHDGTIGAFLQKHQDGAKRWQAWRWSANIPAHIGYWVRKSVCLWASEWDERVVRWVTECTRKKLCRSISGSSTTPFIHEEIHCIARNNLQSTKEAHARSFLTPWMKVCHG